MTYYFVNNSGGSHPFEIRVADGGVAYSSGVANNNASTGVITFTVPMNAPATLYYQCSAHSNMGNTINIVS
jgi:plastocyanin